MPILIYISQLTTRLFFHPRNFLSSLLHPKRERKKEEEKKTGIIKFDKIDLSKDFQGCLTSPYSRAPFSTEISRTKPPGLPSRKRTFRKTNDFIARRIESRSLDDEIERVVVESEQEAKEEEEKEEEDTREMQRVALRIPPPPTSCYQL